MDRASPGSLLATPPPRCWCCHDRRQVLSAEGEARPCSRCNADAFSRWYAARRAKGDGGR